MMRSDTGSDGGASAAGRKKSDTLDQQIKNVGYKPEDVKYVILSHAHLDHAGGMTHFPKAQIHRGQE